MPEAKLDFSLPPAPQRRGGGPGRALLVLAGFAGCGLLLYLLLARPAGPAPAATGDPKALSDLAAGLEERTIFDQAADCWVEYLEAARPAGAERGRILFRLARCRQRAGQHAAAVRRYLEAEAAGLPEEQQQRCARHLDECLAALGKDEVRRWENKRRLAGGGDEADPVLAEVDGAPIRQSELDAYLRRRTENIFQLMEGGGPPPAELSRFQEEQLRRPEARQQALTELITARLLYLEGLRLGLDRDEETRRAVEEQRQGLIGHRVITGLREGIELGDREVEDYYRAHREEYVQPPAVRAAFVRFAGESEAAAALAAPDELVFEAWPDWLEPNRPLPGLGFAPEAQAQLFALEPGGLSPRPVRAGDAWYLFRVDEKRPARELPLAAVRDRARQDLFLDRLRAAQERLQTELQERFRVRVFPERPAATPPAATKNETREATTPTPTD